jgi:hypothetical protein
VTTPQAPPEGYRFFTDEYQGLIFTDPAAWGITDYESIDAARVMLIHEACGCAVPMGKMHVHDAWHAALGG